MTKDKTTHKPFEPDATNMSLTIVASMIERVVRTPPQDAGDTGRYHFYFRDDDDSIKTFSLTTAQFVKGQGTFTTLFFATFHTALRVKNDVWLSFINHIGEIAEAGNPDETPAVTAGYMIFEHLAHTVNATTDKKDLIDRDACKRLVVYDQGGEKWVAFPTTAIKAIITDFVITVDQTKISQAMTACGLKKVNTYPITPTGKPSVRCWLFSIYELKKINPLFGEGVL